MYIERVTIMRPMTDLCSVCQQNSTAIMRTANVPEEEKSEICYNHEAHDRSVQCLSAELHCNYEDCQRAGRGEVRDLLQS